VAEPEGLPGRSSPARRRGPGTRRILPGGTRRPGGASAHFSPSHSAGKAGKASRSSQAKQQDRLILGTGEAPAEDTDGPQGAHVGLASRRPSAVSRSVGAQGQWIDATGGVDQVVQAAETYGPGARIEMRITAYDPRQGARSR
jgi:hypothetical protein